MAALHRLSARVAYALRAGRREGIPEVNLGTLRAAQVDIAKLLGAAKVVAASALQPQLRFEAVPPHVPATAGLLAAPCEAWALGASGRRWPWSAAEGNASAGTVDAGAGAHNPAGCCEPAGPRHPSEGVDPRRWWNCRGRASMHLCGARPNPSRG